MESWTTTDFERDVNLQRAITKQLEQHIIALDDVDNVSVTLVVPKTELFAGGPEADDRSIIITPKPGSDFTTNRKKIEGVQRLIKLAVAGLKDENIVITDNTGHAAQRLRRPGGRRPAGAGQAGAEGEAGAGGEVQRRRS